MICSSCRDAGSLNRSGYYEQAQEFHDKCEFKDCFCQHFVGEYHYR